MGSQCILISLTLILTNAILGGESISLPGCPDRCGEMLIPYPFGTKEGCYFDSTFLITCDNKTNDPPTAFLRNNSNTTVTEIMLLSGELRALRYITHECYNSNWNISLQDSNHPNLTLEKFTISYTKNKLTVVGCEAYAFIEGYLASNFIIGCKASCENSTTAISDDSCAGNNGCCQISIPKRAMETVITLKKFNNFNATLWRSDRPCISAFVAEETAYNFSTRDFQRLTKADKFPVTFDWTIGDQTCEEAKRNTTSLYACRDKNSYCYDSDNGPGYRCNCTQGYQGNPYIQDGCQDIDECTLYQPCIGTCFNTVGSYYCSSCPKGYKGDGKKDGTGCIHASSDKKHLTIALGISISFSALLLVVAWLYWGLHKRKLIELRKKHFEENGGIALQQLLSHHETKITTFKIFTADELNKATDNYDESRVLGKGGQGTVYKGELPDTTIVAIKKSNAIDKTQVQQFINEVAVLSQINHRNVVKLLGCCLETQVPMLVYEFIANGTLFDHIQKTHTPQLPWNTRLRIAAEIATALSYLHYSASIPIIHRDIKTTNILLDDNYTAKVSDFGTSKFSPVDKTSLTTLVQGTFGYLDPEYFFSSHLTEKSDVYSFGVVLVELLTGEKALSFDRKEEERSLAMYFVSYLKEERLFELVDESVKRQVDARQLNEVAMIAAECLNVRGEDRPTMKEVAVELEGLAKAEMHPFVEISLNADDQETEVPFHGDTQSDIN